MRGVQGAALRRQRSRLEAQQQRRNTTASLQGVPGQEPPGAAGQEPPRPPSPGRRRLGAPTGIVFGITLFHIGLVFLFIGFLMVITAMIPGYMETAEAYDLVGTGTFFVALGGVLTLINRVLAKREEDSLQQYVAGRLARSKSGGRLVRDTESGLTPEVHRRPRPARNPAAPRRPADAASPLATNDVHLHVKEDGATEPAAAAPPVSGKNAKPPPTV